MPSVTIDVDLPPDVTLTAYQRPDGRGPLPRRQEGQRARPFEAWQEENRNDFDGRPASGPVEGINNQARGIAKRAYGLKSADSPWTRLVLDLNRARDVVTHTIGQIRELVVGFRAIFSGACS